MENLQSEIIFIIKYGGLLFTALFYFYYVVKLIILLHYRQKNTHERLKIVEEIIEELKVVKTQHEMNHRKK